MALLAGTAWAARQHVITFGKAMTVKLFLGPGGDRTTPMKVRSLLIDGNVREFTTGESHTVTDRVFAVQRAFRLNDSLPGDSGAPQWLWQRGGWLTVDRITGRISTLRLAYFDPFYSHAVWFRDYVAYCGLSDDGAKLYAVVMQLGRNRPILRQDLGAASQGDEPAADCAPPTWEKSPVRVSFHPARGDARSFAVRGHAVDPLAASEKEAGEQE